MAAGIPSNQLPHNLHELRLHRAGERQGQLVRERTTTTSRRASPSPTRPTAASSSKLTGEGGVIRAGGGLVYDRFGSDLVTQFDSTRVVRPVRDRARRRR